MFIELSNGITVSAEQVEAVTLENDMTVIYTHHNRYETTLPKYLVIEMIENASSYTDTSSGVEKQHFAG